MCIVCTDSLTGKSFLVSLLSLTGFPRKCHATHCVLFIYYLLIILPTEEKPEGTIIHGLEMVKLNEMTQAQLRSFIPRMLRATTGESPQWGKEESKPLWWPSDIPFQNIKKDERSDAVKERMPWKSALQQIVHKCSHTELDRKMSELICFSCGRLEEVESEGPQFEVIKPTKNTFYNHKKIRVFRAQHYFSPYNYHTGKHCFKLLT